MFHLLKICNNKTPNAKTKHTRWFKVTFLSTIWRSLNLWRGSLTVTIPKKAKKNCHVLGPLKILVKNYIRILKYIGVQNPFLADAIVTTRMTLQKIRGYGAEKPSRLPLAAGHPKFLCSKKMKRKHAWKTWGHKTKTSSGLLRPKTSKRLFWNVGGAEILGVLPFEKGKPP